MSRRLTPAPSAHRCPKPNPSHPSHPSHPSNLAYLANLPYLGYLSQSRPCLS